MADDGSVEDLVAHILDNIDGGAMMTKFIVLIEGIDQNGERAIYMSTQDRSTSYDNMGMLDYALETERCRIREDRL